MQENTYLPNFRKFCETWKKVQAYMAYNNYLFNEYGVLTK